MFWNCPASQRQAAVSTFSSWILISPREEFVEFGAASGGDGKEEYHFQPNHNHINGSSTRRASSPRLCQTGSDFTAYEDRIRAQFSSPCDKLSIIKSTSIPVKMNVSLRGKTTDGGRGGGRTNGPLLSKSAEAWRIGLFLKGFLITYGKFPVSAWLKTVINLLD